MEYIIVIIAIYSQILFHFEIHWDSYEFIYTWISPKINGSKINY